MKVTSLLGNRALIEFSPDEETSPGGVYIPGVARKQQAFGKVVMLGKDRRGKGCGMLCELKVGDIVKVDIEYGSQSLLHDGKTCRIVSVMDVIYIISKNGT